MLLSPHEAIGRLSLNGRRGGCAVLGLIGRDDVGISRILRAAVSSGQAGRETPAGIFSIIQKDAEHHSNLYDDAYMPHRCCCGRGCMRRGSRGSAER
jgi:hypothetical protein